jgi:hypothetical protein
MQRLEYFDRRVLKCPVDSEVSGPPWRLGVAAVKLGVDTQLAQFGSSIVVAQFEVERLTSGAFFGADGQIGAIFVGFKWEATRASGSRER